MYFKSLNIFQFTTIRIKNYMESKFMFARNMIISSILVLSLFTTSFAGTTGKLSGRLTDKANGEPLLGVNIIISDTRFGASSDLKGYYFVLNIEPGIYTVRFQMIGYSTVVVEKVKITADLTTNISLDLSQTVLELGHEVIVTAERPLIQKDVTATQSILLAEDIKHMPINSFSEILVNTAGVVQNANGGGATGGDNGIHIRGGRSKEIAYMVDGFFVEDALYGGMGTDVADVGIAELSIITGAFNAEYGEAMSGVVNIVTKEGTRNYSASLWASTDQWSRMFLDSEDQLSSDWGSKRYKATLGGPIPFLNYKQNNSSFYIAGDFYSSDTYLGRTQIQRTSYRNNEDWIDLNGNSEYDVGEPFTDDNDNDLWDGDIAYAGGAYLLNQDEEWDDINGNGVWDAEEEWFDANDNGLWDVGEAFTDANGNDEYDFAESLTDINGDGVWSPLGSDYFLGSSDVNFYQLKKGEYRRNVTYIDRTRVNSKIVFRPMSSVKLIFGGVVKREERRPYQNYYKEFLSSRAIIWEESDLFHATLTHTLSANTFYTIKVSKFVVRKTEGMRKILDNDHKLIRYDNVMYNGDSLGVLWSYNPEPFIDVAEGWLDADSNGIYELGEMFTDLNDNGIWDIGELFFEEIANGEYDVGEDFTDLNDNGHWDDINTVYGAGEDFLDLNGNGVWDGGITNPLSVLYAFDGTSNYEFAGAYPQVDANGDTVRWLIPDDDYYQDYTSTSWSYGASFTSQLNEVHQIKIGAEFKSITVEDFWISGLNSSGSYIDYKFRPKQGEIYIQDKMEFSDMIMNLGFRMDYLDPKSKYIDNPLVPFQGNDYQASLDSLPDAFVKWKFSPRIGIGYPATDKMLFHFSYGQFFQSPEFNQLYARSNLNSQTNPVYPFPYNISQGYIPTVGNPNLEPETTISYEFGVQSIISDDMVVSGTLFYKDIYNYITATIIDADPTQYSIFLNNDYANTRGFELAIRKRYANRFQGSLTYSYSKSEGNASNEFTHWWEAYSASVLGTYPAKKTITLPWDQPHAINLLMDYRVQDNWGINVIGSFGSGFPYTATDARGRALEESNNSRLPATLNMDVRLNKDLIYGGSRYTLFVDILNLLDRENIRTVFSSTGKPNESANPNTSIENKDRPYYYSPPRSIEVGVNIDFN